MTEADIVLTVRFPVSLKRHFQIPLSVYLRDAFPCMLQTRKPIADAIMSAPRPMSRNSMIRIYDSVVVLE